MSAAGAGVRRAALLGAVTGARTFLAPAALALRGRLGTVAKFALPALAAGELVGDKLPTAPPRSQGPGLVGRVVSGAFAGRVSGGGRGARVGASFALASTYPSQALRAAIVKLTSIPDIAVAIPEDLIGASLAAAASAEPRLDPADPASDVDGPKTPATVEFSARQHEARHGIVTAAACGIAAAAVGTGAMTSAQNWFYGLTGAEPSQTPALYGITWGLPFGVLFGRGDRPPGPVHGIVFGLDVWLAGLAALPALGVADPPWRRPASALAQDLAFHLVYGTAIAAAYEAFTAR
jgi:uncharacterized membrane protein